MRRNDPSNLPPADEPKAVPAGMSAHRFVEALRTYIDMTGGHVTVLELGQLLTVLEDGIPSLAQLGQHQATVVNPIGMDEAGAQLMAGRLGLRLLREEGLDRLFPA